MHEGPSDAYSVCCINTSQSTTQERHGDSSHGRAAAAAGARVRDGIEAMRLCGTQLTMRCGCRAGVGVWDSVTDHTFSFRGGLGDGLREKRDTPVMACMSTLQRGSRRRPKKQTVWHHEL